MTVDVYNCKKGLTDKVKNVHKILGFIDGSFFLYTNEKGVEQILRVPPQRFISIIS